MFFERGRARKCQKCFEGPGLEKAKRSFGRGRLKNPIGFGKSRVRWFALKGGVEGEICLAGLELHDQFRRASLIT